MDRIRTQGTAETSLGLIRQAIEDRRRKAERLRKDADYARTAATEYDDLARAADDEATRMEGELAAIAALLNGPEDDSGATN